MSGQQLQVVPIKQSFIGTNEKNTNKQRRNCGVIKL